MSRLAHAALCLAIIVANLIPVSADSQALEEVIVTARKVEEDLFDLPMSVKTLSGDYIEATDLTSLFDAQFDLPGLVVTSAGFFGAGIGLRGVTDEGGGSLAVAPHVDGIYLGSSSLALSRMFDVERIEVLKGPQGTLYGRNSTGGSINVVSRAPENRFSAAVESSLGSFDTVHIQGHINLAADKVAFRLAVTGSEGDGFIRNTADGRKFAAEDYAGARVSLSARPTARLAIDLRALHVTDDGASNDLWLPPRNFLADPQDFQLTTVTLANPYLSMTNDLFDVELTYDFDRVVVRSISGYANNVTRGLDDCAGLPALRGCVRGVDPDSYEQLSQEVQIRPRNVTSLEWIVGMFVLDTNAFSHFHLKLLQPFPINDYSATADETAYAVFGQATRRINERWSATGGLRFSDESHRLTTSGTGIGDSPTPIGATGSWRDTSWSAGLQYAVADGILVYANVSTGFKSGGFTPERLPTGELDSFDPEHLTAYEVGVNLRKPEGHWSFRGSAFSYDFRDLQVRTFTLFENEPKLVIENAATARIYGLDLSATMSFNDKLSMSGALVWLPKREFVDFASALSGNTLSGNKLSRAPEQSASISLGYVWPIRGGGNFSANVVYDYRSAFFFSKENDPGWAQEGFGLLNLFLRWDSGIEQWYAFASGRNLLDTNYFNQAYLQSSPGHPANYEVGFGVRF